MTFKLISKFNQLNLVYFILIKKKLDNNYKL